MNVIFDLGNVLVRWDPVAIVRSVIDGPGAVRLAQHLFVHPDWLDVDRGSLTLEQAAAQAIERTEVDEPIIHRIYAAVAPSLQTLPASVAVLDDLKKTRTYLICVVQYGPGQCRLSAAARQFLVCVQGCGDFIPRWTHQAGACDF